MTEKPGLCDESTQICLGCAHWKELALKKSEAQIVIYQLNDNERLVYNSSLRTIEKQRLVNEGGWITYQTYYPGINVLYPKQPSYAKKEERSYAIEITLVIICMFFFGVLIGRLSVW